MSNENMPLGSVSITRSDRDMKYFVTVKKWKTHVETDFSLLLCQIINICYSLEGTLKMGKPI